ncbi:MAG: hypothetical protein NT169_10750 [Chloroflexi bacterium]|nr:hypothetical protein [Chloroflexota bacterium]
MPETLLSTASLALLIPFGYALIAASGLPAERMRHAAISLFAALGLAAFGYVATGFALQFGGVGLTHNLPGLDELIWEWSVLGPTWGTGWGMVGLTGWGLTGPAATSGAYALVLANLPWVITAALIPVITLRGRIPAVAVALLGLLTGAVLYPLVGNWIWGGGWLANLGSNLGQGHGLVDAGGAGLVHLLGASAALAGLLVFAVRKSSDETPGEPIPFDSAQDKPLPRLYHPLFNLLGAMLLLIGGLAWITANPLLDGLDPARLALNWVLAAAAGALLPLAYTWLVAGRPDSLMAARGLTAGTIAIAAGVAFVPMWAALAIGAAAGFLTPFAVYVVDHILRIDDRVASLTVHGLGGLLGLLAVGLFADGSAGLGWNGIGPDIYMGVARQGVTGLLAAAGFQPDWPGQMQAQAVGVAAMALFGFFAAWLALAPLAVLTHLLRRPESSAVVVPPAPLTEGDTETPDEPAVEPVEPPLEPAPATEDAG